MVLRSCPWNTVRFSFKQPENSDDVFFQLLICSRCQGAAGVRGPPGFQGYMGTRVGTCYLSVRHSVCFGMEVKLSFRLNELFHVQTFLFLWFSLSLPPFPMYFVSVFLQKPTLVWWPLPERRVDVRGCFNDVLALLPEIR